MKPSRWMGTKRTSALGVALALVVCSGTTQAAVEATARPLTEGTAAAGPLDFRLGDLRRFLDSREFSMPSPDELEEIIVRGRRPEPLPEHKVIPTGLAALAYAVRNPTRAWRILVPDPNAWIPDRSPDDPQESPGAYRARILAPGRIID